MLRPRRHGNEARTPTSVVPRPQTQVAPPLDRLEAIALQGRGQAVFGPDAKRRLVESEVDASTGLDDGQEPREVNRSREVLLVEAEDRDARAVRRPVVHLRASVLRVSNPRVKVREIEDEQAILPHVATEPA